MVEDYADYSCGLRQFPKHPFPEFANDYKPISQGNLSNDMPFWIFQGKVPIPENCDGRFSDSLAHIAEFDYEVLWSLYEKLPIKEFKSIYKTLTGEDYDPK